MTLLQCTASRGRQLTLSANSSRGTQLRAAPQQAMRMSRSSSSSRVSTSFWCLWVLIGVSRCGQCQL
jgi:hypothetical protein